MNLEELFNKKEDLDPELAVHVYPHESLGKILHHPLMIQVPYTEFHNAWLNSRFKHVKEQLQKAIDKHDFNLYVFTHERPYRFNALLQVYDELRSKDLGELIADVWIDSENIHENFSEWCDLLSHAQAIDAPITTKEDLIELNKLPFDLEVYRGIQYDSQRDGLSWTLDRDKAIWFAKRFQRPNVQPRLLSGKLDRQNVLAYMTGRGESEIICWPENVTVINEEFVK